MSSIEEQRTCVYGLRNQTRCVHALVGESESSIFLVGTLGLNTENTLHVLAHSEIETHSNDETSNAVAVIIYKHPHEIHYLSSSYSPNSKHIMTTSYNVVGEKSCRMRSTCWKLNLEQLENLKTSQSTTNHIHPEQFDLEPLFHFDDSFSKSGVRK
ncbi:hypothetical protein HMI54_003323 [Coelomomyces lativittatus]|nr:hypothetical protein HMI55_002304 [Coelomomyces lativittatus]KAJ1508306.1 hypothetical protein HMI54_003323 [Coelomomyces lativittatus]